MRLPLALAALALALSPAAAHAGGGVIADDYPAALAEARARRLPLFVEAWAPW